MNQPIKAGDVCLVLQGLGQGKSPNVGLVVVVAQLQGEHSRLGRIWRCTGPGIKQLTETGAYADTGWADFPVSWLQKLEPPKTKSTTQKAIEA